MVDGSHSNVQKKQKSFEPEHCGPLPDVNPYAGAYSAARSSTVTPYASSSFVGSLRAPSFCRFLLGSELLRVSIDFGFDDVRWLQADAPTFDLLVLCVVCTCPEADIMMFVHCVHHKSYRDFTALFEVACVNDT